MIAIQGATIELSREAIEALRVLKKNINTRSSIPILGHALVKAKDGVLSLASTNLETAVIYREPTEAKDFAITLPLDVVVKALKGAKTASLIIEETSVLLHLGSSSQRIFTLNPAEFPYIADRFDEEWLSGPAGFMDDVEWVSHYAAKEESRGAMLMGACLSVSRNGYLHLVATDGFRLGRTLFNSAGGPEGRWILPDTFLKVAQQKKHFGRFIAKRTATHGSFQFEGYEVITRFVDGQYPNYQQVIPPTFGVKIVLDQKELLTLLRSAVNTSGRWKLINLSIDHGTVGIYSDSFNGHIDSTEHLGPNLSISFNGDYLIDILQGYCHANVVMEFNSDITPCKISHGDGGRFSVLMPCRR